MTFVDPYHIHREPIRFRPEVVLPRRLKDIEQSTVRRQCFSKGKTDKQFLRCICDLRLKFTTIRERNDDDGLLFSIDTKKRRAHQKNRHKSERDDTLLFLPPIACLYGRHRYSRSWFFTNPWAQRPINTGNLGLLNKRCAVDLEKNGRLEWPPHHGIHNGRDVADLSTRRISILS